LPRFADLTGRIFFAVGDINGSANRKRDGRILAGSKSEIGNSAGGHSWKNLPGKTKEEVSREYT
jgi:hypothetical protein